MLGVGGGSLPTDADCKGSLFPVSAFDDGQFAPGEGAGAVEDLMAVAVFGGGEGLGVGMGVGRRVDVRHSSRRWRT